MRPCQSLRGLPPDVAEWMRRWTRRRSVSGRCFEAMRHRPDGVIQQRGCAIFTRDGCPNGMLHTWGTYSGRVVDPTAHQIGDGPMALYRMRLTCPKCKLPTVTDSIEQRCWCFRDAKGLARLILDGPVYEEPNAPDIRTIRAALAARRAA